MKNYMGNCQNCAQDFCNECFFYWDFNCKALHDSLYDYTKWDTEFYFKGYDYSRYNMKRFSTYQKVFAAYGRDIKNLIYKEGGSYFWLKQTKFTRFCYMKIKNKTENAKSYILAARGGFYLEK